MVLTFLDSPKEYLPGDNGIVFGDPVGPREEWNWGGQTFPCRQMLRSASLSSLPPWSLCDVRQIRVAFRECVLFTRLGFHTGRSNKVWTHYGGLPCRQNPGESGPRDCAGEVPGRRVRAAPPVPLEVRRPSGAVLFLWATSLMLRFSYNQLNTLQISQMPYSLKEFVHGNFRRIAGYCESMDLAESSGLFYTKGLPSARQHSPFIRSPFETL